MYSAQDELYLYTCLTVFLHVLSHLCLLMPDYYIKSEKRHYMAFTNHSEESFQGKTQWYYLFNKSFCFTSSAEIPLFFDIFV